MVYPPSIVVLALGGPPPSHRQGVGASLKALKHSVDIHHHNFVSVNSQTVITYQGDIVELGLEGCHCLEQS